MKQTAHEKKPFDVLIIGGGTGAMGAAYALSNRCYSVAVVEQEPTLGGTACNSWVETWIEGLIPPHIETICREMGIKNLEHSWLRKDFAASKTSKGFYLKGKELSEKYESDLKGKVLLLTGHRFLSVADSGKDAQERSTCKSVVIQRLSDGRTEKISARFFVDASADGVLCKELGVECYSGRDSSTLFGESIAPKDAAPYKEYLNEPSLFFRIEKGYDDRELLERCKTVYAEYESDGKTIKKIHHEKAPYLALDGYLGDHWVNPMSGTGAGKTGFLVSKLGVKERYEEFLKRTIEYWKFLKLSLIQASQQHKSRIGAWNVSYVSWGYTGKEEDCASYLGIRESNRVRCEYMLRQDDLTHLVSTLSLGESIAVGSHSVDFHVMTGLNAKELEAFHRIQANGLPKLRPYGIPYKCLIPYAVNNVLVASRCFGASQIAHASARINVVMAQLGWAAGNAIRFCLDHDLPNVSLVDVPTLQSRAYMDFVSRVAILESKYNDALKAEIQSI